MRDVRMWHWCEVGLLCCWVLLQTGCRRGEDPSSTVEAPARLAYEVPAEELAAGEGSSGSSPDAAKKDPVAAEGVAPALPLTDQPSLTLAEGEAATSSTPDGPGGRVNPLRSRDGAPKGPLRGAIGTKTLEPRTPQPAAQDAADAASTPAQRVAPSLRDQLANWPPPRLALYVTGRQQGYIEPCGCSGLENMSGGLSRRDTSLQQLRQLGWPLVPLDVGNQVRRVGRQSEIKFQTTVDALRQMGYQGIALGADDLRLSVGELVAVVASVEGRESPFVAADLQIFDSIADHRIVEAGGLKLGITAVLGSRERQGIVGDEVEVKNQKTALEQTLKKLQVAGCDALVLLAHTSLDESRQLASEYPQFDLIISAGGAGEPPMEAERVPGQRTHVIQVGTKGMYAGVVGLYADDAMPVRYQRVALDARFTDSAAMMELFAAYQQQLQAVGFAGLEVKAVPHPTGRTFVGSSACSDCHSKAAAVFDKTPHAHATQTLMHPPERSDVPRHHDPECLSCHVTGWNPQEFFPYESGYWDETTAQLHGNGCENCHGPGSSHVAAETGAEDVLPDVRAARRLEMRLTMADAEQKCMECHDLDNSPEFHQPGAFAKYWSEVEHTGKD